MTERTIVKRASLEEVAEGWDDSCYAYVRPATFQDRQDYRKVLQATAEEVEAWQHQLVETHFISGKIKVYTGSTFELVDMERTDLELGAVNDRLAMEILGIDPKAVAELLKVAPTKTDAESTSETSSSETSPSTSPTTS